VARRLVKRRQAPELDLPRDFETKIVRYSTFSQAIGAPVGGAGVALRRSLLIERTNYAS
jgi:LysR family transcriptional regulator, glycine cleavage system transcriptional activator